MRFLHWVTQGESAIWGETANAVPEAYPIVSEDRLQRAVQRPHRRPAAREQVGQALPILRGAGREAA